MTLPGTAVDDDAAHLPECWCCGRIEPPERLVHLGNHPEVAVCVDCAHFLHQRAGAVEDLGRTGPAVRIRDTLRHARGRVVHRGWHRSALLGRPLRWLGRHLP